MFIYNSPIGSLAIEMLNGKIIRIELVNHEKGHCLASGTTDETVCTERWLDSYFQGKQPNPNDLPIMLNGTPFQNYIWSVLLKIPYGEAFTYGQIAKMAAKHFGKEKISAQAVGQAISRNPILIVIPCHRVIGSNKKLTGFSAGTDVKRWLLDHEGIQYIT